MIKLEEWDTLKLLITKRLEHKDIPKLPKESVLDYSKRVFSLMYAYDVTDDDVYRTWLDFSAKVFEKRHYQMVLARIINSRLDHSVDYGRHPVEIMISEMSVLMVKNVFDLDTSLIKKRKPERTIVLIKPDAVKENIADKIVERFQDAGFEVITFTKMTLTREEATTLYAEHKEREGFNLYIDFMTSGPLISMILEGENAVAMVKAMTGSYDPKKARPGTLRYDFGVPDARGILNVVHASDSPEKAIHEMGIFFPGYSTEEVEL